jgi:hypothetical protein
MRVWPLAALLLAASARAGVIAMVPGDLVSPLSSSSLAPIYQSVATLLPAGSLGDGSRGQLAAYLDAGDYGRVQTYFKDRMLPAFAAKQPLAVRALALVAPASARFRESTELGRVTAAFDALKRPDSPPVTALNEQLNGLSGADPAEMSAGLERLFDGIRRRSQAGEISELYARFVLGEAAKPVNASAIDEARKRSFHARLGAEMGSYSSEPPRLSGALR